MDIPNASDAPPPQSDRRKRGRSPDTLTPRRREKFEAVLRRRQPDITIVLENIWDPHNVSAILRTADAIGINTVHLLYYIEALPDTRRTGKQSSASANKWLDFRVHRSVDECIDSLHEEGFAVYASHLTREAMPLYTIDATRKTAFILGNESRGVSDAACEKADGIYFIPMMGMVQSLNVSVAAAVTLYEALRQRLVEGMYDAPRLAADEIERKLDLFARR